MASDSTALMSRPIHGIDPAKKYVEPLMTRKMPFSSYRDSMIESTTAAPPAMSSGRQMSLNEVDSSVARLKKAALATNGRRATCAGPDERGR